MLAFDTHMHDAILNKADATPCDPLLGKSLYIVNDHFGHDVAMLYCDLYVNISAKLLPGEHKPVVSMKVNCLCDNIYPMFQNMAICLTGPSCSMHD